MSLSLPKEDSIGSNSCEKVDAHKGYYRLNK